MLFPSKRLYCSQNKNNFLYIIGFQRCFVLGALELTHDNLSCAKKFYSKMFEIDFPPSQGNNLNKIDYTNYFKGRLSKNYIKLYQKMLELWMLIQEEKAGSGYINKEEFENALKGINFLFDKLVKISN